MTRMRQERLIGIVGGLGPFAHIDFERKLLDAARELIGARRDQDFPQWVLSSIPRTPDRTEAYFGEADDPTPVLLRSLERVQGAGADFAVIACNTAHLFLERVREQSPAPIVSLIEVTATRQRASRRAARLDCWPRPERSVHGCTTIRSESVGWGQ